MEGFLTPDQFVIVCIILVMFFFLIRAIFSRYAVGITEKKSSYDDYLLASRELTVRDIRESMAATYSAFATVFFWFIALGGSYSWLLFLIPFFLFIGNYLFTKYIEKYNLQIGKYSTMGAYIRANSNFKPLHYMTDIIVVVFLFSSLLVEIVIGSGILSSILPNVPGKQLFFVILISLLVIAYVIAGGFRAVVLSDTVQLYLTFGGVGALLIFSLLYLKLPSKELNILYTPSVTLSSFLAFLVSVIAVQIFGPFSQLQNWQRISSSKNQEKALHAHRQGALLGAVLWGLMIICALLLFSKLEGKINFVNIFSKMKESGIFTSYALYPLLFVGFIAAMVSTADSAMAAIYLFLYDRIKAKKELKGNKFEPAFLHNLLVGVGLFMVILIIYYLNQTNLQKFAISIIYFLFNQLIVVFPILFFFIVEGKLRQNEIIDKILLPANKKIEINLAIALFLGWITVLIMTGMGYFRGSLNWIMYASASGVLVTGIITCPSWFKVYHAERKSRE